MTRHATLLPNHKNKFNGMVLMADSKAAKKGFNKVSDAQDVASRLPEMELEAQKLASLILGLRNKSKAGPGLDFHKYRDFENGVDNPYRIDWKASARRVDHEGNDRLLIRDREMQVTQLIYLWADGSESMNFKADAKLFANAPQYTKKEVAQILTMAAAYIALKSSEYFTLLGSDIRLSGNRDGIERIRMELEHGEDDGADLPRLPVHRGKQLGQNSHVFIFSDFLCPLEEISEMISNFNHAGVKGHLVQILDPADVEFRLKGHVKLNSMEGGGSFSVKKGESAKDEIEKRVKEHIRDVEQLAKKTPGWNFSAYVTDQPLHEAMLPLYGIKTNRLSAPTAPNSEPK